MVPKLLSELGKLTLSLRAGSSRETLPEPIRDYSPAVIAPALNVQSTRST